MSTRTWIMNHEFNYFQRKPLRPSSVQNLRKSQQIPVVPPKKNLPSNPISRQPIGSTPPVRAYVKDEDNRQGLQVLQDSTISWSPQPFRNAAEESRNDTLDSRRDTFVVAHKDVFENASITNTTSPRRDTFVVPKATLIHEDSSFNRRQTFITSTKSMITSTPRTDPTTILGAKVVLPSTVKKPIDLKKQEEKSLNQVNGFC